MNSTTEILTEHKKANVYKNLCIFAPDVMKFENGAKIFENWIKLESFEEKKTNFKGILYKNNFNAGVESNDLDADGGGENADDSRIASRGGNEYVICYLGTERNSIKDHIENLVMGVLGKNMQMRIANYFYAECKRKYGIFNEELTLVGHSEGGTEATYVGVKNCVKVVAFNPFGLSSKLYEENADYSSLVTNYRDSSDLVSKLKENIGKVYVVETLVEQGFVKDILGSINSHKIANFGDCENAVPLEDYKKSHKTFLDNYKVFAKLLKGIKIPTKN